MRILLTGVAGFIGSHLADKLLADNHQVIGLDNFITGKSENLAHLMDHPQFTLITQDASKHIKITQKVDFVLHFASPASPNPSSPFGYPNLPIQTLKAGALGTLNTLGVAKAHGARYLLASTSEIYGDPQVHPQDESYWGNVDPIGPRSVYDEAKRFAEALTMAYHNFHGINTRIVRIFNTFGPRLRLDDGRVVPNFIQQALRQEPLTIYGDGKQTRSFCYVDDLLDGILRLMASEEHYPVNIGNDQETSIIDFAKLINKITENPAGISFHKYDGLGDDPKQRRPDITRARTILNWQPQISIEEGLRRTINAMRTEILNHGNA